MARPDVFTQALHALDGGRGVAIACVIGARGSTPRHLGARPRVVRQHLVRDLAMCCGGAMEVVLTPAASSRETLTAVAGNRTPHVLLTPIDGAPLAVRAPASGDPRPHHPVIREGVLLERLGAAER